MKVTDQHTPAPDRRPLCGWAPEGRPPCGRGDVAHIARDTTDGVLGTAFLCRRHLLRLARLIRHGRGGGPWGLAHRAGPACSHPDAVWRDEGCVVPTVDLTVEEVTDVDLPVRELVTTSAGG